MSNQSYFSLNSTDDYWEGERFILEQIKNENRIDGHREFSRLLNILNDILHNHSELEQEEHEEVYQSIKSMLRPEYEKTIHNELNGQEMYVWHISVLSCLDLFRKSLEIKYVDSTKDVLQEFRNVFGDNFTRYLSKFSTRTDLSTDLVEELKPKFIKEPITVSYDINDNKGNEYLQNNSHQSPHTEIDYDGKPTP
jgi:hypothetical protein